MLIEFSVENYLSIGKIQTFSMLAASTMKELLENTFKHKAIPGEKILKSAVLYGPNAAGKSNFITAFKALEGLVLRSHKNQIGDKLNIRPFMLDDNLPSKPSKFEIIFIQENIKHFYCVKLDNYKVYDECLYYWVDEKKKIVFERHNTNEFKFSYQGNTVKDKAREEIYMEQTLENTLFLSQATKFKHKEATRAFNWFSNKLYLVHPQFNNVVYTSERLQGNEQFKKKLNKYMAFADLNICDIKISERDFETTPLLEGLQKIISQHINSSEDTTVFDFPEKVNEILTIHNYLNSSNEQKSVEFEFDWESHGTQKYYGLLGLIDDALENGHTLIIDELDTHLHPLLARKLVELFYSKNTNSSNAQLIFSTHNTNLLDENLFRRDQVWFIDKNRYNQSTEIVSLAEFKKVRNDLRLEKNYLQGRFGAIPLLDDWD